MKWFGIFFSRGIPAYFWLGLGYAIFVAVVWSTSAGDPVVSSAAGATLGRCADMTAASAPLYCHVEAALIDGLFTLPLPSGNEFVVTWTVVFITLGFLTGWIEVVRATHIRDTARNDTASLIVTLIALGLFIAYSPFGTTAFLIVMLVGIGDVLLDRYVGQAVARRDFAGMFPGGGE